MLRAIARSKKRHTFLNFLSVKEGGGGGIPQRKTGDLILVYMSHAMTGNHVTQPAFSCIAMLDILDETLDFHV